MSKINVNTVDTQCGSTLTLGSSGKTVTLASGASQSGFGRTGTVDWCTTAKTAPLTVASGNGYFINTTSGSITVTLPASPSAGDIVAFKDYANTWDTNSVTLARNGSKINGECNNATLNTESQSVTLIYVDGTKGWQDIHDSTSDVTGATFITATGGTVTTCGNFKIHTFTSGSTFTVCSVGNPAGSTTVDYLVIAGGGAGGTDRGGGGGAGGFRFNLTGCSGYPAFSLNAGASIPVSVTSYPITVGSGGAAAPDRTTASGSGTNSVFSTITSTGGGGGDNDGAPPALSGGSGGGGADTRPGGTGNTPPVSPVQGFPGGSSVNGSGGGGGGGATAAGATQSSAPPSIGGTGGAGGGLPSAFGANGQLCGSYRYYSGGGSGGGGASPGTGGVGGGGPGGIGPAGNGTSGTTNTGGGGGGGGTWPVNNSIRGGNGGSGIVVIRYKFQ